MSKLKLWGPLAALLLLLVSSWAKEPPPPLEDVRRSYGDSGQYQTGDSQTETALVFPDYVDGGGWSVQLVLSNVDPNHAVEVRVEVYDPDGQPVRDLFDSELTLEIPSLGSRVLKSAGSGAIRRGWIQVETGAATVNGLLTYRHSQSGIEVGVKPVEMGSQFALFVEESPTVGAGVAVFKPEAPPRLELRIRDEEGDDPLEGGFAPWGEFHQAARTLPEWFAVEGVETGFLADFRGLLFLETEDESRFAPLGLRFGKGTSSLSAVPAIRTQSEEPQGTSLVFPDYVDGGGWSVQLGLSNVDPEAAAEVRVEVYDPDGQPVRDLFDSDSTMEIPSLGSRVLRSTGSGAIRRGWIQVETGAAAVSGLLTYRHAESGIEVGVEAVQLGHEFALFVEESETIGAGLALFKPDEASRIELRLRDEEGNDPLDGVYLPWRDFHQLARTLPEWFDVEGVDTGFLRDFRGLLFLRTEDESGFAPLGLRFGKGTSSLSAVPAIRIPEGGGIDGGQAPPPTVTLSASPTSIDRGQSTTLTWSSTNAESAEITPDIGVVPTSGTRKVSPNVTTTYRITVTGADGQTAMASVTVSVAISERAALGALFEALGGSGWTRSDNWLTDAPLGDWYGVEVDSQGRLIGLRLVELVDTEEGYQRKIGIGLTGEIPPELGSLTHLRVLDLSTNQLTGPIPPELGNLSRLESLFLWGNQLTGSIPPELGQLSQLRTLSLWYNQLTGPIPPELGNLSNLRYLELNGNELAGPIPVELGQLSNLTSLGLEGNHLTGPIPVELGQLSNLTSLILSRNQLTGPIPPSFLQIEQLDSFFFSFNAGLCAPGTTDFVAWLKEIERHEGPYCNEADVAVLDAFFRNTGGEDWMNSSNWLGDVAISNWYGVRADSLGRVTGLDLSDNGLTGRLPRILGRLAQLTELRIDGNALTGRLPLELTRLPLREFHYADTELCAPVEESFQVWLNTISSHEGTGRTCPPLTDRDILVALYEATDGPNWTESDGWMTDEPLGEWYGVRGDAQGRVISLFLDENGLTGEIPAELGQLSQLQTLALGDNQLTGPIPPGLGNLSNLRVLALNKNELAGPIPAELGQLSQLQWLDLGDSQLTGPIPPELGQLSQLQWLDLGDSQLMGPIPAELGQLSQLQGLDLGDSQLTGPIPPELGQLSQLQWLDLGDSQLTGPIPPELGQLSQLQWLDLGDSQLTGPIPPELGQLSQLRTLSLRRNQLTGPIPSELGKLAGLTDLSLSSNMLTGEIPPELGGLTSVTGLYLQGNALTGTIPGQLGRLASVEQILLSGNELTGPIPPEFGNLSGATYLDLDGNALSGPVPRTLGNLSTLEDLILSNNELTGPVAPEFGGLSSLKQLVLTNNPGMEGALPLRLTELSWLEGLLAGDTDLCAPSNPGFQTWLKGVYKRRLASCVEGEPPLAFLTQAVQSREFPVPLVAGEKALLRVFPTAGQATSQGIPAVRARFYRGGRETHVENIPGKTAPVPTQVNEGTLSTSANAEIPAEVIQPGLEMVIEVDPEGTLDSALGVATRIPETGRLALEIEAMPVFGLTLIPFIWTETHDSSIVDLVEAMATDPKNHEMLEDTRTLLPISDLRVTAHEPVLSSSNSAFRLLEQTKAIRAMEGGTSHYKGLMSQPVTGFGGLAELAGWSSFSTPRGPTLAHELGHNMNLQHAPCEASGDSSFPYLDGSIGVWGYDFRDGGSLVQPSRPDLMSYCFQAQWISDFHFTNALRYRLHTAASGGLSSLVAAPGRSLLLWGGVDAGGVPFLEPAFVVEAPASLPRSTGDYRIIGRTGAGDELFSLSFEMPEVADGDGRSSFAFVLPVQSEWADQLASITLSGPGGSVTLDQDTDRPVTILRNPRTRQIRAILRGAEAAPRNVDAAVSALLPGPGLERLTSRGIPDPEDWTR